MLPITFTSYYKWIDNEKPNYRSKTDMIAIENEINKIVINGENNEKYIKSTSLEKIVIMLKQNNNNLKCSKSSVDAVLIKNQIKLLKPFKTQRKLTNEENSSDNKNDLLARNFSTQRPFEKIGMVRTWFKNLIINGKKMKFLVELATDMHNDKIVGWKVNKSENTATVLDVIKQIELESNKIGALLFTTIQTDLGSANDSQIVANYFKNSTKLIHSKSLSGFKGNQVSECLNRWIKRDFKIIYGRGFNTLEDFIEKLTKFIGIINLLDTTYFFNKHLIIRILNMDGSLRWLYLKQNSFK